MGIRYEKDTILNWVEELGKFLRLIIDKYDALSESVDPGFLEDGYQHFFQKDRFWFHNLSEGDLFVYVDRELEDGQIRSLALLLYQDAKYSNSDNETKKTLYLKAKSLLNFASNQLGQFSFEDYGILADIENQLSK